ASIESADEQEVGATQAPSILDAGRGSLSRRKNRACGFGNNSDPARRRHAEPSRVLRGRVGNGDEEVRAAEQPASSQVAKPLPKHARTSPRPGDQVVQSHHHGARGTARKVEVDRVVDVGADPLDIGGQDGLPLALSLAECGYRVGINDIDADKIDEVKNGHVPFREAGAEPLLTKLLPTGRLELSRDPAMLRRTRTVILVIGTPIDEFM